MPEPKIERYDIITVETSQKNQYGDLTFTDTEGKSHKIGNKRTALFPAIVSGRAVKLGYATYMNKEYIASADLFDGQPQKPNNLVAAAKALGAVPVETPPPDKMTPDMWDAKEARTRKSIERQKSLELVVNLVVADKIPLQEASTWAVKFEKYLETGK